MTTPAHRQLSGRVRLSAPRVVLLLLGAASLLVAWALASPVGSVPDENDHIEYAYGVATGQTLPGREVIEYGQFGIETGSSAAFVQVQTPVELFQYPHIGCYQFKPTTPAECGPLIDESAGPRVDGDSFMTRYPPLFYAVEGLVFRAGLAMDLSGPVILLLGRIVAGLMSLSLVAAAVLALSRRFAGRAIAIALLAALTPMAVYLFSSINPNGLEIAAAVSLAASICCVRYDVASGGGRVGRGIQAFLVVNTFILCWARPLSWLWAILLLVLLWPRGEATLRRPFRVLHPVTIGLTLASVASALAWAGYASQLRSVETIYGEQWSDVPIVARVFLVVLKFGDIVQQAIGVFGWLDTPLPLLAMILFLLACGTVAALAYLGRRGAVISPKFAALGLAAACGAVALHSFVAAYGWQGRYVLPAFAALFVLLVPALSQATASSVSRRRVGWVLVAGVLGIQLLALVWNMWRYAYGYSSYNVRLPAAPLPLQPLRWSPLTGQEIVIALALFGVVTIGACVLWSRPSARQRRNSHGLADTAPVYATDTVRQPSEEFPPQPTLTPYTHTP